MINTQLSTLKTFSIEINDQLSTFETFSYHQLFQLQLCQLCHTLTLNFTNFEQSTYVGMYQPSRGTYLGQRMQTINQKCLWWCCQQSFVPYYTFFVIRWNTYFLVVSSADLVCLSLWSNPTNPNPEYSRSRILINSPHIQWCNIKSMFNHHEKWYGECPVVWGLCSAHVIMLPVHTTYT